MRDDWSPGHELMMIRIDMVHLHDSYASVHPEVESGHVSTLLFPGHELSSPWNCTYPM